MRGSGTVVLAGVAHFGPNDVVLSRNLFDVDEFVGFGHAQDAVLVTVLATPATTPLQLRGETGGSTGKALDLPCKQQCRCRPGRPASTPRLPLRRPLSSVYGDYVNVYLSNLIIKWELSMWPRRLGSPHSAFRTHNSR